MDIQAYFEDWSLKPGETARMAISTAYPWVRATLVRLLSGPGAAPAVEGRTADFGNVLDVTLPGRLQTTAVGSYAVLPLPSQLASQPASIHCWIWPTVPERAAPQAIWSLGDVALVLREGGVELRANNVPLVSIEGGVVGKHWYSVAVTLDGERASIDLKRLDGKVDPLQSASRQCAVMLAADTLTLAAAGMLETGSPALPFNGKIDSPTLYRATPGAEQLAAWRRGRPAAETPWAAWKICQDFADESIAPAFTGAAGRILNGGERGVTGRNWDGTSDSFLEKPDHYCALQFHDDDMAESGWTYDLEFRLPETLTSGVYAVRRGRAQSLSALRAPARGRFRADPVSRADQHISRLRQRPSRLARFLLRDAARQSRSGGRAISLRAYGAGALMLRHSWRRNTGALFDPSAAALQRTPRLSELAHRLVPALPGRYVYRRMARACWARLSRCDGRRPGAGGAGAARPLRGCRHRIASRILDPRGP
jgi:hypothetical protein